MTKSFFYIVLICLVCGFSSCKKWIDLQPRDGIVASEFWNTKEQVDAAVIGIYTSMQANTEFYFVWGEARTDMVAPGFVLPRMSWILST